MKKYLITLIMLVALPVYAETYHVRNDQAGTDPYDTYAKGGYVDNVFTAIGGDISTNSADTTVIFHAGTHNKTGAELVWNQGNYGITMRAAVVADDGPEVADLTYSDVVIDGGGSAQFFRIARNQSATFQDLTIQNFLSDGTCAAFGLATCADFTVEDCKLSGNTATGVNEGPVFYSNAMSLSGTITFTDNTIDNNSLTATGSGGGAICINNPGGDLTFVSSGNTYSNNSTAANHGGLSTFHPSPLVTRSFLHLTPSRTTRQTIMGEVFTLVPAALLRTLLLPISRQSEIKQPMAAAGLHTYPVRPEAR
jgi:hypothetical protein